MDEAAMTRPGAMALAKPEDVGMSRDRVGRIGEVLQREVDARRLPGAVSLVARRGRVVHFKAFGTREPVSGAPMERDSLFRIYSMTKPIVSVALMMLVEEGRLLLSDPLSGFIPAFRDLKVAATDGSPDLVPAAREITIQDLLCHRAGLTYDWIADGPVQRLYAEAGAGRRDQTNAEQAEILARLPLLSQPGVVWHYGRSTDLVGRVIEIVSGRTLGSFLSERVFEPLGMMETGFAVPPAYQDRIAEPFAEDPETGESVRLFDVRIVPKLENGGGGLVSTASDYARFLHMVAAGGTFDDVRPSRPRDARPHAVRPPRPFGRHDGVRPAPAGLRLRPRVRDPADGRVGAVPGLDRRRLLAGPGRHQLLDRSGRGSLRAPDDPGAGPARPLSQGLPATWSTPPSPIKSAGQTRYPALRRPRALVRAEALAAGARRAGCALTVSVFFAPFAAALAGFSTFAPCFAAGFCALSDPLS